MICPVRRFARVNLMGCFFSLSAAFLIWPASILAAAPPPPPPGATVPLFDGKTLAGWEGSPSLWRVEDGAITGGSLTETVKQNEFLATTRDYTNFVVRFKIKLTGTNGFINSGFQIRSQRVPNNSEMAGYQCDFGEPNWYGAIYDESRRNKVMSASDMNALRAVIRKDDWNDYVIRADGPRVTTWINGVLGTDYIEADLSLPDWGKLGIQVHGGGKALVQVKDISIEELPPTPQREKFIGAPEPKQSAKAPPVLPEEERAAFTLPPGFEIELVVQESEDIGKFVAVDWDLHGNLWTMTALEYPVDANESPDAAKELYASKAKDKVVVFDRDPESPMGYSSQPRVFADGLAIPLGILPYKNGVYVQHGPEIVFLSDTNGDGRADKREVILSGFGVQDSHLFPHQFTRAPGNWIWMAQGAFNYGKVKTTTGQEQHFDQTRMAKFRSDGSDFDITSQGPCNIWGLVLTAEGEAWIQEANDYGYPVMPFHEYANYPGCSDAQFKSYAPEFPGTATDFAMGGTGLSGLALSDKTGWPEPYADVMYVANPITRKIQAIKISRHEEHDGWRYRYQKLPDFVQSSDEWFRPVALRLGPDGCLYIVDWYNKIISHNEVPRNHPDRDKKRGRIWRVKHKDVKLLDVPDFMKLSGDELLGKLGGDNTTQSHLAWQAIIDRQMRELIPKLNALASDKSQTAAKRIASLWAAEGLRAVELKTLQSMLTDDRDNVRREAVRAFSEATWPASQTLDVLASYVTNPVLDAPVVRAEVIRTAGRLVGQDPRAVELCLRFALPSLAEPTMKSTQHGRPIKTRVAYEREFERYLIRMFLEKQPQAGAEFLNSAAANFLPVENRLLATLALEPKASATRVAQLLPQLDRPPGQEEILRLAQFPDEAGVGEALQKLLQLNGTRTTAIESLINLRTKLNAEKLTPFVTTTARELLNDDSADTLQLEKARELGARLAGAFKLAALEPDLVRLTSGFATKRSTPGTIQISAPQLAALRALRELRSDALDIFEDVFLRGPTEAIREEGLAGLAASRSADAPQHLLKLWPQLIASQRRSVLASLTSTRSGAAATVQAVRSGVIGQDELDAATLDKLSAVLGNDPDFTALMQETASLLRPALRLNGDGNAWSETDLTLDGPFTVETWVKLDPGIDNNDGILGSPSELDMNFHDGQFRVWVGGGVHDAIVAKKKMNAGVWTHLAVTRDSDGRFRIYLNGELDSAESKSAPQKFEHCRIGWTTPGKGTAGWLNEFRVWNRSRSPEDIRSEFDRSYEGERTLGLVHYFSGLEWGKLQAGAQAVKTQDSPALLTATQSKAVAEKFSQFHALAEKPGDVARGKGLFTVACQICHSVGGQGGQIGPVLNGAGALGVEALLRNLLTPNAAMEPGYRVFRIELKDGEVLDGLRVSEDHEAFVLRRPNSEDVRVPRGEVRRASFTKMSVMPEGLLDALPPGDVSDLFAYLKTLK